MCLYQRIEMYPKVWVIQTDKGIIQGMNTDTEEVPDLCLRALMTHEF